VTAPNVDQDQAAAAARELDPDAQLDLLDRELARRRAEREAEGKRRDAKGGPCVDCGATLSWLRVGVVGRWHQTSAGPRCVPCHEARGGDMLGGADDREARAAAIRAILGTAPAPARAGHGDRPARDFWHDPWLVERAGFRWFSEVAGARPDPGAGRFSYITAGAILANLYP
jgi:hypothetical protein